MANEEVKTKLVTPSGKTVIVDGDSLPPASSQEKGTILQGESVLCRPMQNGKTIDEDFSFNEQVRSLRASGALQNDKFALVFDLNGSGAEFEHYGDLQRPHEYTTGQTVTLDLRNTQNIPTRDGYRFIGFALTENSQIPDYPYDENDAQTYTLTFVDDDIVLYAVWQLMTVTITYSLGEYGQGSVPAAQTVREGGEAEISFLPAPTVNDGSGRVFVGWSTSDGQSDYVDARYRNQDGYDNIYPYDDVTLYPVFCMPYTLTYALGNDGTGSVPSAKTVYNGQRADIDFNPSPSCLRDNTKVFAGWSYTDEDSSATFTPDGTNNVYVSSNITLYPVFVSSAGSGYITINNLAGEYDIKVIKRGTMPGQPDTTLLTVTSGSTENFYYTENEQVSIEFDTTPTLGTAYIEADSVYSGSIFPDEEQLTIDGVTIKDAYDNNGWTFSNGDKGTIRIVSSTK